MKLKFNILFSLLVVFVEYIYGQTIPPFEIETIFEEDFENGIGNFVTRNAKKIEENHPNCFGQSSCVLLQGKEKLISKNFKVSEYRDVRVSFIFYDNPRVAEAGDPIELQVKYNGSDKWTTVGSYEPPGAGLQVRNAIIRPPPEANKFRIRFRNSADLTNERYFIDNVVVRGANY